MPMPTSSHDETPDHEVIPAPEMNWTLIWTGLFSLLIFGMIAHGNTLAAIALCALAAVILLATR